MAGSTDKELYKLHTEIMGPKTLNMQNSN